MSAPLVSICIPTYHRPQLLARAVRSVLAQTYGNFEIIITDNSENDESRDLITTFNEPRIHYFKNPQNIGFLKNIEKVAALATGKYFTVLMDDDLLKPKFLERMVAAFEQHPTVGVAWGPMSLINDDDRRIFPYFYVFRKMYHRFRFQVGDGLIAGRDILKEFLVHDYPCCVPSGLLYRTECFQKLGSFDLHCGFPIDVEICMRIATCYDFYYVDEVLSAFRCTSTSQTTNLHKQGSDVAAFYYVTRKTLADERALGLFPPAERARLVRDSIFFCSCRALLNVLAGLRLRSGKLILETLRLIFREDRYWYNKLRLPWFVSHEIFVSFFPRRLPPPKE